MASTSANESKTKDNYRFDLKSKQNYKSNDNFKPRENGYKPKENNFKPRESTFRPRENEYKPRDNGNSFKPRGSDYKPRDNSIKTVDNRNNFYYPKNNSYQRNTFIDKDEDTDNRGARGHRVNDTKGKSTSVKDKEQQPDKFETIKRLEREKKALQKKLREDELEKQKRPPLKQKNIKINWKKGYEKGLFDEDEDFSEYL